MAGYSHKTWACPFFRWDERLCVRFTEQAAAEVEARTRAAGPCSPDFSPADDVLAFAVS